MQQFERRERIGTLIPDLSQDLDERCGIFLFDQLVGDFAQRLERGFKLPFLNAQRSKRGQRAEIAGGCPEDLHCELLSFPDLVTRQVGLKQQLARPRLALQRRVRMNDLFGFLGALHRQCQADLQQADLRTLWVKARSLLQRQLRVLRVPAAEGMLGRFEVNLRGVGLPA